MRYNIIIDFARHMRYNNIKRIVNRQGASYDRKDSMFYGTQNYSSVEKEEDRETAKRGIGVVDTRGILFLWSRRCSWV